MEMEIEKTIENKDVRFHLSGIHYTGRVLSYGDVYIKIRDVKSNIVFLRIDAIISLEVLG